METLPEAKAILDRFQAAKARRSPWEAYWKECYDFALPQRNGFGGADAHRGDKLFDATAPDAVDQLAASLLSQLTPPWSQWFGLRAGRDLPPDRRSGAATVLERATATLQAHFDRSNFAVEMHQCFLDLVTGGTACLLFEENEPGAFSAFRFASISLAEAVLEEGTQGRLDTVFRRTELTLGQLLARYPDGALPAEITDAEPSDARKRYGVVEAVCPDGAAYDYWVVLDSTTVSPLFLARGRLPDSPFISFRWLKSPGESYGRSPVMKALPDIKTANKVVELILKNASIAVTGMWQADDDGVLNPATIRLVPGTIIPKAVGSAGLSPLEMPGRFDVSQLVLSDLRGRIRHALLADRLAQIDDKRMTATEVLERSAEMARLLGATYGRLQSELLTPLVLRGVSILRRRGELPDISIDGRLVELDYRSPLARAQAQRDVQGTLSWIEKAAAMGPEALQAVDLGAAARWLGQALGVPPELIRDALPADPSGQGASGG